MFGALGQGKTKFLKTKKLPVTFQFCRLSLLRSKAIISGRRVFYNRLTPDTTLLRLHRQLPRLSKILPLELLPHYLSNDFSKCLSSFIHSTAYFPKSISCLMSCDRKYTLDLILYGFSLPFYLPSQKCHCCGP